MFVTYKLGTITRSVGTSVYTQMTTFWA